MKLWLGKWKRKMILVLEVMNTCRKCKQNVLFFFSIKGWNETNHQNCKLQNFEFFKGQQFTKLKYILKVISPQKLHCSYTKDAELWQLRMSHGSLCSRSKNLLEILLGMLACLILARPSTEVKCLTFQTMLDCVVIFLTLQMHFQTFSSYPLTHTFLQACPT